MWSTGEDSEQQKKKEHDLELKEGKVLNHIKSCVGHGLAAEKGEDLEKMDVKNRPRLNFRQAIFATA